MKLDPELIKNVLEWCEDNLPEHQGYSFSDIEIPEYDKEAVKLHAKLLCDSGYITFHKTKGIEGGNKNGVYQFSKPSYEILDNLSLNGYQYLKLLKSPAWTKAKSLLHETGVIFAEGAINALIDVAKANLIGG